MKRLCHPALRRGAVSIAVLFVALTAAASARTMTFDDYDRLVNVSDATISPDGKQVVFTVWHKNLKTDRNDRDLMLIDVSGGLMRKLSFERRGVGGPQWSPDGSKIAFFALSGPESDQHEQLFVMDLRGGDPVRITNAPIGVEQFKWRPDSQAIAYVAAEDFPNKQAREKHHDFFIAGDESYLAKTPPTPRRIWLIAPDGSNNKPLTKNTDWSLPGSEPPSSPSSPISWSPDGRYITFTKMDTLFDADADHATIAVLDTQSGMIRKVTSHAMLEGYSEFSPDGSKISYWYPFNGDGAAQNDIYVADAAGGDGNDVTAADIDTNVQRSIWMPDSKSLLVSGHKNTDAALWIKHLGGAAQRLPLGAVQPVQAYWLDASVSSSGALAFTASEPNHPVELYYMSSAQSAPRRLTNFNDVIAALDLGKVQPISWQGPDGFTEDGVLTYPPNYQPGKKYPLALVIHGGPNSASITAFSPFNQLLAAKGWVVFNPNYRGSDNLGEKYWYGIVEDAGAGPGRDVMAGIDAVEQMGIVDPNRIAVSGWSYGGYMTSWMIGHYHIWKAAVSGAAVNNLIDEYALADNGVGWRYQMHGLSPWSNRAALQMYREQSPLTYVANVTTPTLILSDTGDERVPITQSYEMYHALKDHGVPVRFYAYPVGGHFPDDPVRSRDVYERWAGWLAQYLK